MKRHELEHVIRAAAVVSDDDEIIVVGSQAIVGQFDELPAELCISIEADVYPKNHPERADLIDGCIGEGSPFHDTFGYYAQGVSRETAVLPSGWEARCVPLSNANTRGATGYCLEVHDLTIANAVAGREKDLAYLTAVVPLVDARTLEARLAATALDDAIREATAWRLARHIPGFRALP